MGQNTITLESVPYIEFDGGIPSIGACTFVGDSEALGENSIPFQQVLQEFIGSHLFQETINDPDRELLLDLLMGIKVAIKEAKKQVLGYPHRDRFPNMSRIIKHENY